MRRGSKGQRCTRGGRAGADWDSCIYPCDWIVLIDALGIINVTDSQVRHNTCILACLSSMTAGSANKIYSSCDGCKVVTTDMNIHKL